MPLYILIKRLIFFLSSRSEPYFVSHIRSHTNLPGFITEGNARVDHLTMPVQTTLSKLIEQARLSNDFYHQNALALTRTFKITKGQAQLIVQLRADCQRHSLLPFG